MYENELPFEGDIVMISPLRIDDSCVIVSLPEYDNIEGIILFSELSKKRIRSIISEVKIGHLDAAVVIRVDTEKGYVDLSRKRITDAEIKSCEERYNKSRLVHSIMGNIRSNIHKDTDLSLNDLYVNIGWPLARGYGNIYDAFKLMKHDPQIVLNEITTTVIDTSTLQKIKDLLKSAVLHHFTIMPLKIMAEIEVTCYTYEGIMAIIRALKCGESNNTVKVNLITSPLYSLTTITLDRENGYKAIKESIENIKREIESANGKLVIKSEPKLILERDEKMLKRRMDKMEYALRQVDEDVSSQIDSDSEL